MSKGKKRKIRPLINKKKGRKYTAVELHAIIMELEGRIRQRDAMVRHMSQRLAVSTMIKPILLRRMIRRMLAGEIWLVYGFNFFGRAVPEYQLAQYVGLKIRRLVVKYSGLTDGLGQRRKRGGVTSCQRVMRRYVTDA